MGSRWCSFCGKEARYFGLSKEDNEVARCEEHVDNHVPKCSQCNKEATHYHLTADTNLCDDHA